MKRIAANRLIAVSGGVFQYGFIWSHRLSVRTSAFHAEKRGSIPLGTTNHVGFTMTWERSRNRKNFAIFVMIFGTIAGRSSIGLLILRRGFDSLWSYHIASLVC